MSSCNHKLNIDMAFYFHEQVMKLFLEKANRHLSRLEQFKIRMSTISDLKMKPEIKTCRKYQTGDCKEKNPIHHTRDQDGNCHYYVHLCDICPRLRNSYGQHMGYECEIITEIDRMIDDPHHVSPKIFKEKY